MARDGIDLEQELDRLYSLAAAEFVAARNELAKRLRQAGERDAAGRIKKLPRPSLTAWAVNQLAFRAGAELEGLRAAGEAVRAAHLAGPKEQRAAAGARRDAITTLRLTAEVALQEAGTAPTRVHRRRIVQTLEVLSSRVSAPAAPRAGRLSTDLGTAGFDALSDLAAALTANQEARPAARKKIEPKAPAAGGTPAQPKHRPAAAGAPAVVEHPTSKRAAEDARRAAARAAGRRRLDRRREQTRARLAQLEEELTGLCEDAERTASELDEAKRAEADVARAAREAERLAREARARAEAAAEATARARRQAESASAARQRVEAEVRRARQQLERFEDECRELEE